MDRITIQIVTGILECDNATKQELGQRLARHLRLKQGPGGRDDGIDGRAEFGSVRVLFQSKLRKDFLGPDEAKIFWADLIRHGMNAGIYLAGMGYSEEFRSMSQQINVALRSLGREVRVHLLTLHDILDRTEVMQGAAADLPPVTDLAEVIVSMNP
jgi:hypothetical protein